MQFLRTTKASLLQTTTVVANKCLFKSATNKSPPNRDQHRIRHRNVSWPYPIQVQSRDSRKMFLSYARAVSALETNWVQNRNPWGRFLFEWAWQHPTMSLAVREAAKGVKTLGGTGGKIKLAYTMLTLPEWRSLNLTVNFLSTKHINNTKGCPTLPSHMKVQICPVDELPCYTDYWVSDDNDLEEGHCSSKSDVSEPEEAADGDTIPSYYKMSTNMEKKEEKENDLQRAKKCRGRGGPRKQQKSKLAAHESGSEVTFSSTRDLSLEQLNAQVTSVEQDKLNIMFARPDSMLQISDSEDINDNYMGEKQSADFETLDSPLIPHPSISVNLWEQEDKLSDVFRINCSEANTHEDNLYEFSIKHKTTTCTDQAKFPSLQEYSPLCYISPLKTAEEVSYSLISPCKSTPTDKLMNLSCSFLSPVVSCCPIITISSTPRRVSRCVIDLTDSPVT
eukprot:Gb_25618 [translate_table: standard]